MTTRETADAALSARQVGLGCRESIKQTARLARAVVRKAVRGDGSAIAAIYNETIPSGGHSPITDLLLSEAVEKDIEVFRRLNHPAFVMQVDDEVVAYFNARSMRWASGACDHTADISVYVRRAWWGSGAAMLACVHLYDAVRRKGYDKVTCWILGANTQSLAVAKAFGLEQWALMPGVVRTMGVTSDLKVYGVSMDDIDFITRMSAMRQRSGSLVSRASERLERSAINTKMKANLQIAA